ncbi:MAG: DUF4333 domain-containing protein [Phormidesmis sp. CAN_BIN44]|nr:DUF4333 domain-containing protein [Phormidesmis sp. CAN_BIN44]
MLTSRLDRFPVLLLVCALTLTSCEKPLDTAKIQDSIRDSVIKQGGTSLKSVICPTDIKPMAGQTFECTGVLDSGSGVAIAVTQQDAQGNIQWEVPSVKGLLNLSKLQATFQEGLQKAGGQVTVDCGGNSYKPAKPGEVFDCKVLKPNNKPAPKAIQPTASTPKPNQPDSIQVKVDLSGDVSWQPIVQVAQAPTVSNSPKTTSDKTGSNQAASAQSQPEKASSPAPDSRSSTPPAGKSAEDFLNQPGATDDFE